MFETGAKTTGFFFRSGRKNKTSPIRLVCGENTPGSKRAEDGI